VGTVRQLDNPRREGEVPYTILAHLAVLREVRHDGSVPGVRRLSAATRSQTAASAARLGNG